MDFVVARGPALHRTAVLLTRQEQSAEDLVQIALAKAWRSWGRIEGNHEAYVRRIIVNEFASSWRRRWRGEVSTADLSEVSLAGHGDHGGGSSNGSRDLGEAVSTRQSLLAALATLPPRQRAVVVLRSFHDYTEAATAEAMGTSVGTVKSQTFNALVAGARRHVVVTRRRRLAVLGAATAAVLVVGGLAMTRPAHQALPQPAGLGPFTVSASGAGFPQYSEGMKRLTVVDAPMLERTKGSIVLGVATAAKTTVLANVFVSHAIPGTALLFKDARIHVAIYESVRWEDYPLPQRPADMETSDQYAWSNEPGTVRVLGPKTAQEANKPVTFTQRSDSKLILDLEVRGPGRMRVLFDGVDVSRQIGYNPQTHDNLINIWAYIVEGFQFPIDPGLATLGASATPPPALKPGTPVTVTIIPQDFQGPDWRIAVQPDTPSGG